MEVMIEGSKIYKMYVNGLNLDNIWYVRMPKGPLIEDGQLLCERSIHPARANYDRSYGLQRFCSLEAIRYVEPAADFEVEWFEDCESRGKYIPVPPNGEYYVTYGEESFRLARSVRGIPVWESWAEEIIELLKSDVEVKLVGDGPQLKTIGFLKGKCMRRL